MAGKKVRFLGITFDSILECECFKLLINSPSIKVTSHHKTFQLEEPFEYEDYNKKKHKYTNIEYTPDLIIKIKGLEKPIAVEIKGLQRNDYMLRKKLFIKKYKDEYYHLQLNSIKETKEFIKEVESWK